MSRNVLFAVTLAAVLVASTAEARIVGFRIDRVEPFAGGATFGAVGAYERVVGVARGEVDPADPRNAGIVNLARAPRNARGLVEFETDVNVLRPVDPRRANGKLLYEVNNRGRKLIFAFLMDATAGGSDPQNVAETGNGFVLRLGYTLAWSGWDADAPTADGGLTMRAPVATDNGRPIVKTIRDELVSGTRGRPVEAFRLSYEAATLEPSQATLSVRSREADPPRPIPSSGWTYGDSRTVKLLPAGTKPEPGALYDFRYPATNPRVLGLGLAATRDVVSFLRYGTPTADDGARLVGPVSTVVGIGFSQSGRYLRDHIGQGFNQDEAGRKVFDGVLSHIAGVGRVFLNAEFGQPARTNTQHEDHFMPENAFPFSAARLTDPVSGRTAALLRGDGFDPRLIEVNTSTEYWQKGASLLHTDPAGRTDVTLPALARAYLVAGTQHGGRAGVARGEGPCANVRNPHSPAPALRALLVALDRWVTEGAEPPPSQVPTVAGDTLASPERLAFPAVPGMAVARETNQLVVYGDWVDPRPDPAKSYRVLVPRVDGDGNEVAGIRLPDIAVPLATYTGWNLYKAPFPEGELCDRDGSFVPFATTRAERERRGDPRLSLEERYGSVEAYARRVEAAVAELVKARLLLPEDAERYVAVSKARPAF